MYLHGRWMASCVLAMGMSRGYKKIRYYIIILFRECRLKPGDQIRSNQVGWRAGHLILINDLMAVL